MPKPIILILYLICLSLSATAPVCPQTAIVITQLNLPSYCNNITLTCDFVTLTNLVTISATYDSSYQTSAEEQQSFILCIFLPSYSMSLGPNSQEQFHNSVYIECNDMTIKQNYTHINHYQLIIQANDTILVQNDTILTGGLIWLQADNTIILNQCKIQNSSSLETQCSCYQQTSSNCDPGEWKFNFPSLWTQVNLTHQQFNLTIFDSFINYSNCDYNTIILYSQNLVLINASQVVSSLVGIFSTNVTILNNSLVSVSGNGFPSASGYGCGYFDQILNQLLGCTGSGGSHGGFGGNSWPDNCNLMISRPPYYINYYPTAPGSGGGFFLPNYKQASSGGGVINIQGLTIDIWNSIIEANGKPGTQGGGGGAGGSIALDYIVISGNSKISADGGSGKSSGGGGRLWLWNHDWRFQTYDSSRSQFTITAKGGLPCSQSLSCGQNGSISTSPCQPGFQLNLSNFICQNCSTGYYQSQYGYDQCQKCVNKPANSQYIKVDASSLFPYACNYTCDFGYIMVNEICLSSFMNIINTVGGINMLISVGIIICVIIGYLIIILFQKLTQKQLFNKKGQQDQLQRKMHFKVEDIPYHEKRIYFSGSNSPRKPWHISEQTKNQYERYVLPPISKLDPILNRLCKQINAIAKYSKTHHILITILKFYYYPLSRYLEQLYRVEKSQAIQKLVIQVNKKIPESENLGIKFHVEPYCTIGCIQIFNFNKSALDFYIQDYFPIYFQLEKMPLGGYCIDLNDPFMKAFITQIDQKDNKSMQDGIGSSNKIYEKYIIQLDELLRNTQQLVPILNHLWMMTEFNSSIQVYLYQPGNRILGVQPCYSISAKHPLFLVFSSQNINRHHFISEQPLKNIYHHKVEYFNNQYKFRQQVIQDDKKSVFWEIQNNINQKFLSWSLGILTIFLLLQVVVGFFVLVFIQAEKQVEFDYGSTVFFVILPFSQFFSVYLCFRLILSKNCRILADSLYFTLGNILKFSILIILGMIANINSGFNNILMEIIFYLWTLSLVCNIMSMLLKLLLHWHYSRHQVINNRQQEHSSQKKMKMN